MVRNRRYRRGGAQSIGAHGRCDGRELPWADSERGLGMVIVRLFVAALLGGVLTAGGMPAAAAESYDVVVSGGRVLDPESGLDASRNIGIRGGKIAVIADAPLVG